MLQGVLGTRDAWLHIIFTIRCNVARAMQHSFGLTNPNLTRRLDPQATNLIIWRRLVPDATESQSKDVAKSLSRKERRRPGRLETVSPEILALLRDPAGHGLLPQDDVESDIENPPAVSGKVATPESQIMEFLIAHRGVPLCDVCLMQQVRHAEGPQVAIAIRAIGAAFGFRRATIACEGCGEARLGIKAR
jgi:hypothetical protein